MTFRWNSSLLKSLKKWLKLYQFHSILYCCQERLFLEKFRTLRFVRKRREGDPDDGVWKIINWITGGPSGIKSDLLEFEGLQWYRGVLPWLTFDSLVTTGNNMCNMF